MFFTKAPIDPYTPRVKKAQKMKKARFWICCSSPIRIVNMFKIMIFRMKKFFDPYFLYKLPTINIRKKVGIDQTD